MIAQRLLLLLSILVTSTCFANTVLFSGDFVVYEGLQIKEKSGR